MLSKLVSGGPKYAQKGVRTNVDLTTYLGPNPQVYCKVPIISPVHQSRASQHPWLPDRSTKPAVGALTALPLETEPVRSYDPWWHTEMGILAPPSQGVFVSSYGVASSQK